MRYGESRSHLSTSKKLPYLSHTYAFFRGKRFSFSRLDPLDPTRLFTFILQVNGDDKYEIVECEPPINVLTLMGVSSTLNETDDMSYLVRKLRKYSTAANAFRSV